MVEKTLYTHVQYTPVGEPYLSIKSSKAFEQHPFQVIGSYSVILLYLYMFKITMYIANECATGSSFGSMIHRSPSIHTLAASSPSQSGSQHSCKAVSQE